MFSSFYHRCKQHVYTTGKQYTKHNTYTHYQYTYSQYNYRFYTHSTYTQTQQSYIRRLLDWYSKVLDSHPYTTQMATSGFLGGIADVTTQCLEHKWDAEEGNEVKQWDWRRLAAVTAFGIFAMGPFGHIWYLQLDKFCTIFCRSKTSMVLTKIAGDTFLFGPIALWTFFASVSLMEGMEWIDVKSKLYREFIPTYLIDYSMWPIVQGINFACIPVRHQLMFVNTACYFDDIFLSYIEHNGLPRIFRGIERWWANYIDLALPDSDEEYEAMKKAERAGHHDKQNVKAIVPA